MSSINMCLTVLLPWQHTGVIPLWYRLFWPPLAFHLIFANGASSAWSSKQWIYKGQSCGLRLEETGKEWVAMGKYRLYLARINQARGPYGRMLTKVVSTDRMQWGLYSQSRSIKKRGQYRLTKLSLQKQPSFFALHLLNRWRRSESKGQIFLLPAFSV